MIAMQQQPPRMMSDFHFQQQEEAQQQQQSTLPQHSRAIHPTNMDCVEEEEELLQMMAPSSSRIQSSSQNHYSHHNMMADLHEVQRVRDKTKELLIVCVQAHCTEARNKAKCVQAFVRRLEQALFDTAPTLPDYANSATLPLRVAILLPRIKQDFQRETSSSRRHKEASPSSSRALHANASAGPPRLAQLVATIREERQALVGASCPKCVLQRDGNTILPGQASFGSQLDPPVAQLFFQTPLVEYFSNHYPSPHYPWDQWEHQAEAHLQAYYEWKAQHYVCER